MAASTNHQEINTMTTKMTNETATQLESLPKVDLDLLEVDGNAFAIAGAICRAGRRAGWTAKQISQWAEVAQSGDYNHLLASALAVVA